MNMHTRVAELAEVNMTSKGQVLIPKAIRDRVGLVPGSPVAIGINDRGEAVVLPKAVIETQEGRRARIRAALATVRGTGRFGMVTDEYMALIRGPYEDER